MQTIKEVFKEFKNHNKAIDKSQYTKTNYIYKKKELNNYIAYLKLIKTQGIELKKEYGLRKAKINKSLDVMNYSIHTKKMIEHIDKCFKKEEIRLRYYEDTLESLRSQYKMYTRMIESSKEWINIYKNIKD